MTNRMIEKNDWKYYFNLISRSLENQKVELEVSGLDIGDQIEAAWVPFDGISYDSKADCIFVHTPLLDHTIVHPTELLIAEVGDAIVAINIKDAANNTQMVHFHRPITLEDRKGAKADKTNESHPER